MLTEPVTCSYCGAVSVNGGTLACAGCHERALAEVRRLRGELDEVRSPLNQYENLAAAVAHAKHLYALSDNNESFFVEIGRMSFNFCNQIGEANERGDRLWGAIEKHKTCCEANDRWLQHNLTLYAVLEEPPCPNPPEAEHD